MPKNQIEILENGNLLITLPIVFKICGQRKKMIMPDSEDAGSSPLLLSIARAYRWQKMIDDGRFKNIAELANVLGIDPGAVARTIRLTLLSPKIIHKIIAGEVNLLQEQYRQSFPDSWEEQEKFFFPQYRSTTGDCWIFVSPVRSHVGLFVIKIRSETNVRKNIGHFLSRRFCTINRQQESVNIYILQSSISISIINTISESAILRPIPV